MHIGIWKICDGVAETERLSKNELYPSGITNYLKENLKSQV